MATGSKLLMDEFYALNRAALADKDYELAQVFSLAEDHVNGVMHGNPIVDTINAVVRVFNSFLDDPDKYGMNPDHIGLVKDTIQSFVATHGIEGVDLDARWEV